MRAMDDDPFRCRCQRWPEGCTARATQEDMRCNNCPHGCSLVHIGGGWVQHVVISHLSYTLTP